jgi:hypothetical protein
MQEQRTRPATAEDFHRLPELAQARGLRVFEAGPHQWFCTSHTDPFALHVVTGLSCDCRGFLHHQRCSHHAALLAHLGWLPELEVESPAPQQCFWCSGSAASPTISTSAMTAASPAAGPASGRVITCTMRRRRRWCPRRPDFSADSAKYSGRSLGPPPLHLNRRPRS